MLHRIKLADGTAEKVADGFGGGDGLAWDHFGRLFISELEERQGLRSSRGPARSRS